MLAELSRLHDELLTLINELEVSTAEIKPDTQRLTTLRWQLSRHSWLRHKLLEGVIYPHLTKLASPAELQRISSLRETNNQALTASRQHVAYWTIERVLADWAGYRTASVLMRDVMRHRIALEQAVLYPLLDGYGMSQVG